MRKNNILIDTIVTEMSNKKAENIVSLDFNKIQNAICKYFVICDANSSTQVAAISNAIIEAAKLKAGESVWQKTGLDNAEWVILDYADIIVHVFQSHIRHHYAIEELWGDTILQQYN